MAELDLSQYDRDVCIGCGNYGQVYKIRNKETKIWYAAKRSLHPLTDPNDVTLKMLESEINNLVKLKHPAIISCYGYSKVDFSKEPFPVFVMEFADKTLSAVIELERKSISDQLYFSQKLKCAIGIAFGMVYLHSHDILHRDLKPDNILLTKECMPKITDFGLSKNLKSQHDILGDKVVGTAPYIAPEIWKNSQYSKKSDVYAFGMILFEMLTLERPFFFKQPHEVKEDVLKGKRPLFPPSSQNLQQEYKNLIIWCWHDKPDNRPTFEQIVDYIIENAQNMMTISDDKGEFDRYVDYISAYSSEFDDTKRIKLTNDFIQNEQANIKSKIVDRADKIYAEKTKDKEAMYEYGMMLENGEGVKKKQKRSI